MRQATLSVILTCFVLSCTNKQQENKQQLFIPNTGGGEKQYLTHYSGSDTNTITPKTIREKKLSGQILTLMDTNIVEISSYRNGDFWGEELETYEHSGIKKYAFRVNIDNVTFIRRYDSLGNLIHEEGNPLVLKAIGSKMGGDSLEIDFVFADRIFRDFNVLYSEDGVKYKKAVFTGMTEYNPYKTFAYRRNVKGKNGVFIAFDIKCVDKYTNEVLRYQDTLDLMRKEK